MSRRVIVTCGPSFEPIDQVRRLTNFSTGELGILLANRLTRAGYDVLCLKSTGATSCLALESALLRTFSTNDDLLTLLSDAGAWRDPAAIFHAAALSDFRVKSVTDSQGRALEAGKISSTEAAVVLRLERAEKILPKLRPLFPHALIAGWKYEMDGTREQAIARARSQITANSTDACIVNGAAWGSGFGLCQPDGGEIEECEGKVGLCERLAAWLEGRFSSGGGRMAPPS